MPTSAIRVLGLMRHPLTLLITLTLLSATSGCRVSLPNWLNPGHLYNQQLQASQYDPYADVDAGPEVIGGRPRGYQRPRSQAEKSQWSMYSGAP